jgi:paraquat-inducible protein B
MMVNAATLPAGGFVNTIGFYAVPELFERNSRVLYAIAATMSPNQQEIMGRLNENLRRLGQASKTMAETTDVVIRGLRSHTANWDRALDKYNYYLSGEEARYSPLENRIYVVDSNLQKYTSNPNYPQEMLTEVPDQSWNKLPHERSYR